MSRTFTSRPSQTRGRGRGRSTPSEISQPGPGGRSRGGHRPDNSFAGYGRTLLASGNDDTESGSSDLTLSSNDSSKNKGRGKTSTIRGTPISISRPRGKSTRRMSQPSTSGSANTSEKNQVGASGCEPGDPQRGQYAGGYTMFSPNEKKRQQIQAMAQKETENYERHKQQTACRVFSHVGTVGGGHLTEDQVRLRQANDVRAQKYNRQKRQEQLKADAKKAEEDKIEAMRAEQRKKAEQNSLRERNVPASELRSNREAFLQRLEANKTINEASSPAAKSVSFPSNSFQTHQSAERASPVRQSHLQEEKTNTNLQNPVARSTSTDSDSSELDILYSMFPQSSKDYLKDLLLQLGSADAVIQIMT